jgi:hypothetical protein
VLTTHDSGVTAPGLRGEYFRDEALQDFAGVFVDPNLDFPDNALYDISGARTGDQVFSVRWTGDIFLRQGERTLKLEASGGARLWVDERLLFDTWTAGTTDQSALLDISRDDWHTLRLEFHHTMGDASLQLFVSDAAGFVVVDPRDCRQPTRN